MVALTFFAKARSIAGALAAIGSLVISQPALANSSAAAADITAPLRASAAAKAAHGGDEEFRNLFNSWTASSSNSSLTIAPVGPAASLSTSYRPASVSIPSRMPLDGAALTSGYGMRNHPVLGGRRAHKGVDLAMPTGTPIYATADGVVSKADWFSSYGLFISLEHGASLQTRYGHLSRLSVAAGQEVKKGDLIGYVGSTGRSTGSHLHYEVRIAGTAVNPVPYMQGSVHTAPAAVVAMGGPDADEE